MGFCYQENTHFSQAAQCSRENFWGEIKKSSTRWKIESRRSILEAVQKKDKDAINKWLENEEYQNYPHDLAFAEAARLVAFQKHSEHAYAEHAPDDKYQERLRSEGAFTRKERGQKVEGEKYDGNRRTEQARNHHAPVFLMFAYSDGAN